MRLDNIQDSFFRPGMREGVREGVTGSTWKYVIEFFFFFALFVLGPYLDDTAIARWWCKQASSEEGEESIHPSLLPSVPPSFFPSFLVICGTTNDTESNRGPRLQPAAIFSFLRFLCARPRVRPSPRQSSSLISVPLPSTTGVGLGLANRPKPEP